VECVEFLATPTQLVTLFHVLALHNSKLMNLQDNATARGTANGRRATAELTGTRRQVALKSASRALAPAIRRSSGTNSILGRKIVRSTALPIHSIMYYMIVIVVMTG